MSRRKLLIGVSIAGHAALAAGVFLSSVWSLDRLDREPRSRTSLAVITPPAAPSGSFSLPEVRLERKQKPPKVVVHEPRQPRKVADDPDLRIEPGPAAGAGLGNGPGSGPGDPDGPAGGGPCQEPGGCELARAPLPVPELPRPPPPEPRTLRPEILQGLRIRGETAIHPPRDVYEEMYRSGDPRTSASIRICLTASGAVASVALVRSTRYPAYDELLVGAARRWVYRPYTVNGTPMPACGMVTFQYAMK